jgi:hypothetical protein
MKTARTLLTAVILLGNVAATATAFAQDGVISKDEFSDVNYCHMKFHAMTNESIGSDNPVLKDSTSADIIDFYGPCDESPVGKDQVIMQKNDRREQRLQDYQDY